jgi:glycosyltransferase involved in cell wall biosynthesis
MRVNVHDYSGHPFQVQLSRELAARGHTVVHTYAEQYVTGHGRLDVCAGDPATLRIEALRARHPLIKYSPLGRLRFEMGYAAAWQRMLDAEPFDLVVACNIPLFALARVRRYFARRGQRWLLWHQDLYSLAVGGEAGRRLPAPLAAFVRGRAEALECKQVAGADQVVAITDAMIRRYRDWGLDTRHATVIPNWAPIDEITPAERDNLWAREQRLPERALRLLYAGTLGRKHNPLLLLDVLDAARAKGVNAMLVVASEGEGADDLAAAAAAAGRDDVRVVGYQPADRFSEVLSSADAVIALLEPDASRFSVPSKVLSYLSAGRPIVALLPSDNPAAADVTQAGGFVGTPSPDGALAAGAWLVDTARDASAAMAIGRRAREIAQARFDIVRIADRFEQVFEQATDRAPVATPAPALVPRDVRVEA